MNISKENIFRFIQENDNEVVKSYLNNQEIDFKDAEQRTPLIKCGILQQHKFVEMVDWQRCGY